MKIVVHLCITIVLLVSCKEEKKTETSDDSTQMKTVMEIHDEVMPKMGTIAKYVAELKPMVDTTVTGKKYEKAMYDLQASYDSMMSWMSNFGSRFKYEEIQNATNLSEQKQKWLDEEEIKVKALKEQINASIERAEALLAK